MTDPSNRLPIHERFELDSMPVGIGGKKLNLFGVSNWEGFVRKLEEKGDEYLEHFPFWIKFWEASFVLADELVRRNIAPGADVLEIGAGMGLAGLFLGATGHRAVVTDYDEDVLDLLRLNVRHNRLDTVTVRQLDWLNPDLDGQFDIICGSEVVYQDRFFQPMIDLFRKYLKPEGAVVLAHSMTHKCIVRFIGMLPGRFEIENRVKTLRGDGQEHRIMVHTLRLLA